MGGRHVVDWTELQAFAEATDAISESWEKSLLMRMCIAYVNGHLEGMDVRSIPPMERENG